MKILTIVGARPQFIKAAVVSNEIKRQKVLTETIIHTGQHFDQNMSDIFFKELGIKKPSKILGIGGGSHGQNTGRMIEALETIFLDETPDKILVYGDTDSTLAASIAASKINIPIVHIEAGLRSFNRLMPEEVNRVLVDHLSDILFTPSHNATDNLLREGIDVSKIMEVGDVMYDAALFFGEAAERISDVLSKLKIGPKSYILATLHRKENVDNLENIKEILEGFSVANLPIILPIHPRTSQRIKEFNLSVPKNIKLIKPQGYMDMIMLEKNALLIATDSGGVQKEAYYHKIPCVTLRNETEWVELVDLGLNKLAGANHSEIGKALRADYTHLDFAINKHIYGTGDTSKKIVDFLTG